MSLVAYEASSDEEDSNDAQQNLASEIETKANGSMTQILTNSDVFKLGEEFASSNAISDEDDIYDDVNCTEKNTSSSHYSENRKINLPSPKRLNGEQKEIESVPNVPLHIKLPAPKALSIKNSDEMIEEDDEFLHKKVEKPLIEKPPPPKKQPVKITIPCLSQFMEFKVENKKDIASSGPKSPLNLLAMLPQPKHDEIFKANNSAKSKKPTSTVTSLIPDHVKNRMQQLANKNSSKISKKVTSSQKSWVNISDSEESDEGENQDFFSLNSKNKLPEISESELNAMVEKKVSEMKRASKKIDQIVKSTENTIEHEKSEELIDSSSASVDKVALQALVGVSHAKRKKLQEQEIQVVELSSEQILPSRDEWMRAALTAETTYQPKGVLVDEEPAPGTRKKHQITYLAHQAKANEAELQAMWAANRQNRRATASKYGF